MSEQRNRLGLSRTIPADVKRAVRLACGFGCVICGASIVEYEHVDPEYSDAAEHDPERIALLCPSCHAQVTRNFWSKEKVKAARLDPKCRQTGFSRGQFDFGNRAPAIKFSGVELRNCPVPIAVAGSPLFKVEPPELAGGPFQLSAHFVDTTGTAVLQIDRNEWSLNSGVWDAEFTGGRIRIQQAEGELCLVLRANPPRALVIERLQMMIVPFYFAGDENSLEVYSIRDGKRANYPTATYTGCLADNCAVGMSFG